MSELTPLTSGGPVSANSAVQPNCSNPQNFILRFIGNPYVSKDIKHVKLNFGEMYNIQNISM